MSLKQKPHPHSIEAILDLKDTGKKNVPSFRPYIKPENEHIDINGKGKISSKRLVPRAGRIPRASVLVTADTQRYHARPGTRMQAENGLKKMGGYLFTTNRLNRDINNQGKYTVELQLRRSTEKCHTEGPLNAFVILS